MVLDRCGNEVVKRKRGKMKRYLLTILALSVLYLPVCAAQSDSAAAVSPFTFSAVFDAQVQKDLYDEFGGASATIFSIPQVPGNLQGLPEAFDDFWMRIALFATYRLKYFEAVANLRFYPYWTERTGYSSGATDLGSALDFLELNRAYAKVFREYSPEKDLTFMPWIKVGRDGLLNTNSDLFGNYLDQPTGGYGRNNANNVIGPFLNKIVFANEAEAGFTFHVPHGIGGKTSVMIGGNVNNTLFYSAPFPIIYQYLDSKMSAGFFRVYQDLYYTNTSDIPIFQTMHIGGGLRDYQTTVDSGNAVVKNNYFDAQGVFDVVFMPDTKLYTEIAMQKLGQASSSGIARPINAGVTIPTFGVVDTLTVEAENVAKTFFSNQSMRDALGAGFSATTDPFAWGLVVQKKFLKKVNVAWGLYTGDQYGDLQTTLRLSTYF